MKAAAFAMLLLPASVSLVPAAEEAKATKLGWFIATELSVVLTDGNSSTRTIGLKNTLRKVWAESRFRLKLDYLRADTADDRYLLVDPGYTFLPGERPANPTTSVVKPGVEQDVETSFVEAFYAQEISKRVFWNVGASWDTSLDAGILNRYIAFAGVGNRWWDRDDLRFSTSYSASYTDREEEEPDPEKEERFAGLRLDSDLRMKLGPATTFEDDLTANVSLSDPNDYSLDITNALSVKMSKRLSLKVSLQWLFNNEPALEDVDLIARVVLEDPDGTPGTGDEYFRTVATGGDKVTLGEDRVRKEQLDTRFRTTLVIDF